MSEDYTNARTLYAFDYLGETFRVVRRRFEGKHWRGYVILLHGDVPMVTGFKGGNAEAAGNEWLGALQRIFKTKEGLRAAIAEQKQRLAA